MYMQIVVRHEQISQAAFVPYKFFCETCSRLELPQMWKIMQEMNTDVCIQKQEFIWNLKLQCVKNRAR